MTGIRCIEQWLLPQASSIRLTRSWRANALAGNSRIKPQTVAAGIINSLTMEGLGKCHIMQIDDASGNLSISVLHPHGQSAGAP